MAWAPDYILVTDAQDFTRNPKAADVNELGLAITTASRAIDKECNRQFGKTDAAEQRLYTARPDYDTRQWVIDVDDFMDVAGLVVLVDGVALTDFTKEPLNADKRGRPWERLRVSRSSSVQPTGKVAEIAVTLNVWGWTAVPAPVKQGTHLQVSRFMARRDSPWGIAGSPEAGNEMRLLAKLDPDVAVSLRGLKRPRRPY